MYFSFVKCLREDGQQRPKNVAILTHIILIYNYSAVVGVYRIKIVV